MSKNLSPEMRVATLLEQEPRLAAFFVEQGLHCVGCLLNVFCTLAQVETFYNIPNFVERVQTALQTLTPTPFLPPTTPEVNDEAP